MKTKESLTIQELEQLSQAYMECHLSRLEEKELELILLCSDLSSPLIEEVRQNMGLSSLMAASNTFKSQYKKTFRHRLIRYAGIAASIVAIVVCSAIFNMDSPSANENQEVYACVDGEILSGYVAATVVSETEAESMEMLRSIIKDAAREQRNSTQYMKLITE